MTSPIRVTARRILAFLAFALAFGSANARAESPRLGVGSRGSLSVDIVPDNASPLPFSSDGIDHWTITRDSAALVGKEYSIRLANRTDERIKVVVSVDGLNVLFKHPVRGRAAEDVGFVLGPRKTQVVAGWQVDGDEGQRFVFSPGEWSEGQAADARQIGIIEVHVYRELKHWTLPGTEEQEAAPSGGSAQGARRPPVGTGAGEDFENEVQRVHFRPASDEPATRAVIQYGRLATMKRGDRLGVTVEPVDEGLRIVDVTGGSLADEVGLRQGDVITMVDMDEAPSANDLRRAVQSKQRGDTLFLKITRGRHMLSVKIRI
jgi:hypothetical protein